MNKINDLYDLWEKDKSPDNLNKLLEEVRWRIVTRFERDNSNFSDIAQESLLKIWRALPGVEGGIIPFDPSRGDFAAYCATVAKSTRDMMLRSDRLVFVDDDTLNRMIESQG